MPDREIVMADTFAGPRDAHEASGSLEPRRSRSRGERLTLAARVEPDERGWSIYLPVRAERVTAAKRVAVHEEVVVRREEIETVLEPEATVRREELRVEPHGRLEVTHHRSRPHVDD